MISVEPARFNSKPSHKQNVARPLKVLVPLIKEELKAADEASMAHYRKAGEMLIEAKEQLRHGKFTEWVAQNFTVSIQQARIYMDLAKKEKESAHSFSSLSDFIRNTSNPNYNKPHTGRPTPLHEHEKVKRPVEPIDMERMTRALQARMEEAKLERELGLKVVDAGFKVFATKLHPDTGGTHEAMKRLNRVRDRLKAAMRH